MAASVRTASAPAAALLVRDGDHVVVSGCGAAPVEVLNAIAARTDLARVFVSHATAWGPLPHLQSARRPPHMSFRGYFLPATARELHKHRQADYLPLTFSNMQAMYNSDDLRADVVIVTCSPPDKDGYCSLGPFVSYLPAAIQKARVLVGECSPHWPRINGAGQIPVSKFDLLVNVARHPIASAAVEPTVEAGRIAQHVVSLVPNGATIQIGRGAIPNAIAAGLADHRDLGVHSEMISDWVVDLRQRGVLTGARKRSFPGEIVTSFMDGTERLYAFAADDGSLRLEPIYEVNDPQLIAGEPNFVAINSAVELDLSGQINAEALGGHLISGSGGLLDFALGAARSENGKFVVALPSTAKGGAISRIVPHLPTGSAVTVPRALAHIVVTEYGIAELRGCSLQQRAERLIKVAHPRFREELSRGLALHGSTLPITGNSMSSPTTATAG